MVIDKAAWATFAPRLAGSPRCSSCCSPAAGRSAPRQARRSSTSKQPWPRSTAGTRRIATRPDDPAYLVYTSGTTGYPKGVLHGHRSLLGRQPASEYWFDFAAAGDRILHSGKFNWTYVLGSAMMDPLYRGQTVIAHEGTNDAATWPRLIAKHGATIFIGVPTIYRQILQKTDLAARGRFDAAPLHERGRAALGRGALPVAASGSAWTSTKRSA